MYVFSLNKINAQVLSIIIFYLEFFKKENNELVQLLATPNKPQNIVTKYTYE